MDGDKELVAFCRMEQCRTAERASLKVYRPLYLVREGCYLILAVPVRRLGREIIFIEIVQMRLADVTHEELSLPDDRTQHVVVPYDGIHCRTEECRADRLCRLHH